MTVVLLPAPSNTLYTLVALNSFSEGATLELGIVIYKQYKLVMTDNLDGQMFIIFNVFSVHQCTNSLLCFSSAQYVQNDSPSSKSLAGLVVQLLQFQEDAFGRRVNNPALTKLPVRLTHC